MDTKRKRFEEIHAKRYFNVVLDCGHKPSDPGSFLYETGAPMFTGYAVDTEGKRICYVCTAERLRQDMARDGKALLYLSSDGQRVTTWDGQTIGHAHIFNRSRSNFGDDRWYFRFSFNDEVWSGMGRPGMYCSVKRTKYKKLFV